jgi:hypothetical protein
MKMNYRIASENDLEMLSEMRWLHEYELKQEFDVSYNDFINQCSLFLKEGLEKGEWVYWIAVDKDMIIANIYIRRIRKVPKPQKIFAEIGYITNVHTRAEYRNMGIGSNYLIVLKPGR